LRDDVLRSEGYLVLRFHNAQVINDLTDVLETIESHCAALAFGHG
jgi:very-short-patch-repair endonuclease